MDWLMLVLILAFVCWLFQMVFFYRRRIEQYDAQIAQVQVNTAEVNAQVEKFETDHAEKKRELDEIRAEAEKLGEKEKEVGDKIKTLKAADSARRPTRFRLDNIDPSA